MRQEGQESTGKMSRRSNLYDAKCDLRPPCKFIS